MPLLTEFAGKQIVALAVGMSRLGSWNSHSEEHLAQRFNVLDQLSEHGNVLLDTSPIYGDGFSEHRIGEALSKRGDRFLLATKVYPRRFQKRKDVIREVKGSLNRLKVEKVDLVQIHWTHSRIGLDETFEAVEGLKAQGLIGNIGLSGFSRLEICRLLELQPKIQILSNQVELHLGNIGSVSDWQHPHVPWTLAYGTLLQGRLMYTNRQRADLAKHSASLQLTPGAFAVSAVAAAGDRILPLVRVSSSHHLRELLDGLSINPQHFDSGAKILRNRPVIELLSPRQIKLEGDPFRKPYMSFLGAIMNRLDLIPSPFALSRRFRKGSAFFPVQVNRRRENLFVVDQKDPLSEVKRYWAWRLAKPNGRIPVVVIEPGEVPEPKIGAD